MIRITPEEWKAHWAVIEAAKKIVERYYGPEEGKDGWAAYEKDIQELEAELKTLNAIIWKEVNGDGT